MKALDLVLKEKWYRMIESGEKTEEYREIKPYWTVRMMEELDMAILHTYGKICHDTALLYGKNEHLLKDALYHGFMKFKNFDKVTFHLGYSKDRPSMTFVLDKITINKGKPEWGAEKDKLYFVIHLGKRL